jgi:hypothetical protein
MHLKNENQLEVVRGYLELLETIDEAFSYVTSQPLINQVGAAERMFPDILAGWTKLNETHKLISSYFVELPSVRQSIEKFDRLIEESALKRIPGFQTENPSYILIKKLEPSYQEWKQVMAQKLLKVVVH